MRLFLQQCLPHPTGPETVTLTAQWEKYYITFSEGICNVTMDNKPVPVSGSTPVLPGRIISWNVSEGHSQSAVFNIMSQESGGESMSWDVVITSKKDSVSEEKVLTIVPQAANEPGKSILGWYAGWGKYRFETGPDTAVTMDTTGSMELFNKIIEVEIKASGLDRYEFHVKSDGNPLTDSISMTVTLPYDPAKGVPEVYYEDGSVSGEKMTVSSVDAAKGTIDFITNHNSYYKLVYPAGGAGGSGSGGSTGTDTRTIAVEPPAEYRAQITVDGTTTRLTGPFPMNVEVPRTSEATVEYIEQLYVKIHRNTDGGYVTFEGADEDGGYVDRESEIRLIVCPDTGYKLDWILVDGVRKTNTANLMITADTVLTGVFSIPFDSLAQSSDYAIWLSILTLTAIVMLMFIKYRGRTEPEI